MKVTGAGNIENVKLPPFPDLEGFRSYEPESRSNVLQQQGRVIGERTFEKVLIPKKEGSYTIPALSFTYFDPRTKKYETVSRGPFPVEVEKGQETEKEIQVVALDAPQRTPAGREVRLVTKDIQYIKTDLGPLIPSGKSLYEDPFIWLLGFGLPPLAFLLLWGWKTRQTKYKTDIGFARSRRAFRDLERSLKETEPWIAKKDSKQFYDRLSKGLNHYLANKMNRPAASISAEIADELLKLGLQKDSADALKKLYQTFDLAVFSSFSFEADRLRSDLQWVREFSRQIERFLK
jgi:hypothetical protein